jgi:hypothetical protein
MIFKVALYDSSKDTAVVSIPGQESFEISGTDTCAHWIIVVPIDPDPSEIDGDGFITDDERLQFMIDLLVWIRIQLARNEHDELDVEMTFRDTDDNDCDNDAVCSKSSCSGDKKRIVTIAIADVERVQSFISNALGDYSIKNRI